MREKREGEDELIDCSTSLAPHRAAMKDEERRGGKGDRERDTEKTRLKEADDIICMLAASEAVIVFSINAQLKKKEEEEKPFPLSIPNNRINKFFH